MGIDKSPSSLRGLGVPLALSKDHILTAAASYTEQNVVAGTAQAESGAKLVIETAGIQQDTFDIATYRGGTAGGSGGFVWKLETDTSYYGSDGYQAITDYEMLQKGDAISKTYHPPSAVVTTRGDVLVAYREVTAVTDRIVVQRRPRAGTSWESATLVFNSTLTSAKGSANYPCMCILPDGAVLLVHWVTYTMTGKAQLVAHRSTDNGATWSQTSTGALDIPVDLSTVTLGRTHIAQSGGQVLFICSVIDTGGAAGGGDNCILQAASYDEGTSFVTVGTTVAKGFKYMPSLVAMAEGFGLAFISSAGAANFYRIPHAFYDISATGTAYLTGSQITNSVVAIVAGDQLTQGGLTLWRDEDNYLYVALRTNGSTTISPAGAGNGGAWWLVISDDDGETWYNAGGNDTVAEAMIFNVDDNSTSLADVHGVAGQGRAWLFHRFEANPGTVDNSICCTALGGWNTVNLPERGDDAKFWQRGGYTVSYLPADLPADTGVFTTTGAGAQSIDQQGLDINTTATQRRFYTLNPAPASTDVQGIYMRFTVQADSGGDINSNERGASIRLANGSYEYEAVIRVSTTQIRLYDQAGTSTIATATVSGFSLTTTGASILLAVKGSRVSAWYRPADHLTAFKWTELASNQVLTNGGAGTPTNEVKFGHLVSVGTGVTSHFREVLISYGSDTGAQLGGGFDPGSMLVPKIYPPAGRYCYVDQGLQITTRDGPAIEGLDYQIAPRAEYGIERIFHSTSPSPQNGWRSAAVASGACPEQFIPLTPMALSQEIQFPSDLMYLHLEGINWSSATIEGYDVDTASWTTLATVNTKTGLDLDGAKRFGNRVSGDSLSAGGGNQPYLFYNECEGWTCRLGTGGASKYRTIASNSEGSWAQKGSSKGTVLHLSDADAADPSGPTSLELFPARVTVVISLNGATYSAIGLRIASQETATLDIRIGHLSLGSVFVLAPQYGRGRSIEYVSNTEKFQQPDGIIRTRDRGKGRRVFGVSWTEPIDTSQFFPYSAEPEADYYKASNTAGSPAVANYGDGPFSMLGLFEHLRGSGTPVTFLPDIAYSAGGAADVRLLNRKDQQALVMVGDAISIDNVVGEEFTGDNQGEAFRIGNVTLTEVI